MSLIISVERVTKAYRLGTIGGATLQEDVARWWSRLRGTSDPSLKVGVEYPARRIGEQFWALHDVSFKVDEGEVLGIVGRNGAGKSTLLKILSRVTAPTSGCIRMRGRVASLLEVGTGFHPDLTGRENIYLNGAILGMTRAEIRKKFDEIVAFSECEQFIDTPVKRYSSGMYVRLAFAVAAHLEPEILIVDEVLAVGDAQFQKKCLGKMGEVSRGGRTVLFVSHNMVAVKSLCRRAVLLRDGKVAADAPAATVVADYLRDAHRREERREWPSPDAAPGNDALRVRKVAVHRAASNADEDTLIDMTSDIEVKTTFWILKPGLQLHITYHLINEEGIVVLTTGSLVKRRPVGLHHASLRLPGNLLNSGTYTLKFLVVENENRVTYENDPLASFVIVDSAARQEAFLGREPGIVQPRLEWSERAFEIVEAGVRVER